MTHKYDDIIDLPHHQSSTRPHMSPMERAAQFSPFSALSGHGDAVKETARLTDRRVDLDNDAIEQIDEILRRLHDSLEEQPEVSITYFMPDSRKEGGAYVTAAGTVKRIDSIKQMVVLRNGTTIPIPEIVEVTL